MAVGLFRSLFLFSRQRISLVLYRIIPVAIDILFLRARGELRAFDFAAWIGSNRAMAAPSILLVEIRYMAIAVALETSLHLCDRIIKFVDKDLHFLQKAISTQLLGRH